MSSIYFHSLLSYFFLEKLVGKRDIGCEKRLKEIDAAFQNFSDRKAEYSAEEKGVDEEYIAIRICPQYDFLKKNHSFLSYFFLEKLIKERDIVYKEKLKEVDLAFQGFFEKKAQYDLEVSKDAETAYRDEFYKLREYYKDEDEIQILLDEYKNVIDIFGISEWISEVILQIKHEELSKLNQSLAKEFKEVMGEKSLIIDDTTLLEVNIETFDEI